MEHVISTSLPVCTTPRKSSVHTRHGEKGRTPFDALRLWSAITHGVGAALAVLGTFLLLSATTTLYQFAAFAIYGLSMVILYTASTLYHCLRTCIPWRRRLRKLDHCSICLLIAGSYTPICILALRDNCGPALLTGVWAFALAGILLSLCWITAPRWLSAGVYLCMGWLAVFALKPLSAALPLEGMVWLVAGGVLYSIGGVLYALKWPGRNNPRFGCHEIFHVFILLGSVCHYINMYRVVIHL
ncbi:MAG: hemolysin III family protein [Ruminococcaceae bacterium]|nr:hemolysin III family protein [Oscillospiraceae bacterium]